MREQPIKGGFRCGAQPIKGVLGAGTADKGGIRCGNSR